MASEGAGVDLSPQRGKGDRLHTVGLGGDTGGAHSTDSGLNARPFAELPQPVTTHSGSPNPSTFLMELQAVLAQLQNDNTRFDFLAGKIIKVDDAEHTLKLFNAVYEIVYPTWQPNELTRRLGISTILNHIEKLINKSTDIFVLSGEGISGSSYSYRVWMHAFRKLMESTYWLRSGVLLQAKPSSDVVEFELGKSKLRSSVLKQKNFNSKFSSQCDWDSTDSDSTDYEIEMKKRVRKKNDAYAKKRIETIVLSDSSSDSSYEGGSSDSSFRFSSRRFRGFPRDVVQPEVFNVNGKQPLKQFLESF